MSEVTEHALMHTQCLDAYKAPSASVSTHEGRVVMPFSYFADKEKRMGVHSQHSKLPHKC